MKTDIKPLRFFADRSSPRLYDCIVEILRVHHYSRRSEKAYLHWIRRFLDFHQRTHPRQLYVAGTTSAVAPPGPAPGGSSANGLATKMKASIA